MHYPNFEVVVINDGSKDGTLQAVIEAFELKPVKRPYEVEVPHQAIRGLYGSPNHPNLIVIDKENGGKADALNAGINLSRFPLFCAIDADSLLESDALLRAVQPFAEDPDRVVAVGEDLELIVKLHRHMHETGQDYDIKFVPDPVCWTEAPESPRVLDRQRIRWQRGALETFFKHILMLGNPRYGAPGMIGYPHILLVDVLGPPTELLGYTLLPLFWYLGIIQWEIMGAFLALTFIFGIFVSVGSLVLEEMELKRFPKAGHLLVLLGIAVIENFGYRQINSFWRIVGFWQYVSGLNRLSCSGIHAPKPKQGLCPYEHNEARRVLSVIQSRKCWPPSQRGLQRPI